MIWRTEPSELWAWAWLCQHLKWTEEILSFLTGSEWGWPTNFFFLGVCHGAPGVIPRNVMASDNSSMEIVHRRGSHFVVHLAPELRQGKHFYLETLCIWIPLPFYCHRHSDSLPRWGSQDTGLTLQLPWDSPWPDSSFWGCWCSELYLICV